jgi:hypothetical protein
MSYTYSQEQEAAFSPGSFSGIDASAQSSESLAFNPCFSQGSATEACQPSLSSATFAPSMVDPTADALTSWLEAFPVRPTAAHLEDDLWRKTSGRKCSGSWQMSLPGTSLPRTSRARPSTQQPTTSKRWLTPSAAWRFPRQTWVVTTFGSGIGFLHTPTHTANYACRSMQKWPNCREFVRVFGKPSPTNHEWLMGWPIGWTELKPLETGRFRSWLQRHFEP